MHRHNRITITKWDYYKDGENTIFQFLIKLLLPYFKIETRTKTKVVVWVVYDFCNVCLVADFPFSNPSSWSHSSSQPSHVSIFRHNLLNVVYGLTRVHPRTYFVLQRLHTTIDRMWEYYYDQRLNLSIKRDGKFDFSSVINFLEKSNFS